MKYTIPITTILSKGVKKLKNPSTELKYLQRSNFFNVFVFCLVPIFTPIFLWLGVGSYTWLLLGISATCICVAILNMNGYSLLGRFLQLISYFIWLVIFCWLLGTTSGIQYIFIVFAAMPFLFLSGKMWLLQVAVVLLYALGFMLFNNFDFGGPRILEENNNVMFRFIIEALTFSWLALTFYYFNYTANLSESRVRRGLENLKVKNKELERFVYIASHDLQEPVRNVSSFTSLLEAEASTKLNEEELTYISFIKGSAQRMTNLIKSLMEHGKIGLKGEKEALDTRVILDEVMEDLTSLLKKTNAEITINNPQKLPKVNGMKVELRLLFQNLFSNAIKFAKQDVNPAIEVTHWEQGGYHHFSVADNGIGIKAKYQDEVFAMFKRLNSKDTYEGSGIGLAHCKKIVNLHGGEITVSSDGISGTTINFSLKK